MAAAEPVDLDSLWDYDKPAETEQRFHRLLADRAPSASGASAAEILTQIARAQALQGHFEQAHRTLDEVSALLPTEQPRVRIRYLLERGRVFNSSGHPAQAAPLFHEAWTMALAHGEEYYAVDAAHMLAIVAAGEQQLVWNLRALERADVSGDPRTRRWRGSLYNNIGWTHHAAGRFEEAMQAFTQALECRLEQGDANLVRVARWCVARALRSLGRVEDALAMQWALLDEARAVGEAGGFIHEEIGECLLTRGQGDQARPHFAEAYQLLREDRWLAQDEPERLARLQALGQV